MRVRGLTLIEVVAALVLMAGVVSALLLAQGRLLGKLRGIEEQELASHLAREIIAQWKLERPTATQGEVEEYPGWRWIRQESTTLLVRDPLVREVTLQIVHRTADGAERTVASYQWLEKKDEERKPPR
jgi:Tfp pilus assembly protein PilV